LRKSDTEHEKLRKKQIRPSSHSPRKVLASIAARGEKLHAPVSAVSTCTIHAPHDHALYTLDRSYATRGWGSIELVANTLYPVDSDATRTNHRTTRQSRSLTK